jgi:hypothetical protein
MPRPAKGSPEAKAWAEKMRAARDLARNKNEEILTGPSPAPDNDDVGELKKRLTELESYIKNLPRQTAPEPTKPQVGAAGLVGTYEKYSLGKNYYPDPCERLARETRLQRFAFPENYELKYDVTESRYKTIDGINTVEPKFTLKLIVKVFDEVTGEPTNKRYTILQGVFHEDPDAAIVIARDNGIEIDEENERDFLNEMRYLRFRDWLLEAFYPTPPPPSENKREVVVGNRLVEIFEVTSEHPESMGRAFSQISKKL